MSTRSFLLLIFEHNTTQLLIYIYIKELDQEEKERICVNHLFLFFRFYLLRLLLKLEKKPHLLH
jgi:hypothetical protein